MQKKFGSRIRNTAILCVLWQDPDFYKKHGNYQYKIALGCLAFVCFGIVVQGMAVRSLYNR
jgi:hypothetical protein